MVIPLWNTWKKLHFFNISLLVTVACCLFQNAFRCDGLRRDGFIGVDVAFFHLNKQKNSKKLSTKGL